MLHTISRLTAGVFIGASALSWFNNRRDQGNGFLLVTIYLTVSVP